MIRSGKPAHLIILPALAGLILLVVAWAGPVFAQTLSSGSELDNQKAAIEALIADFNSIAAQVDAKKEDDAALVELRLKLDEVSTQLLESAVVFRPRLLEIRRRLDALGPAPGENDPAEPDVISEERQALANEKAEINALIGRAETASVDVNKLIEQISELRRDLFSRTLSKRYDLSFVLSKEVVTAFWEESGELYNTFSYWFRFVVRFKLNSVFLATFFSLVAAVVIFAGGRRFLGPIFNADPDNEHPSYMSRLSVAFWSTLLPSLALAVFLNLTFFLYQTYDVFRGDVGTILRQVFNVVVVVFFINRLVQRVLSPSLPDWRLVPIESGAAHMLVWLVTATAVITGLDFLLGTAYDTLGSPLQLAVAESLIASVLVGLLVIATAAVRPLAAEDGSPKPWPRPIRYPLYLLGAGTIFIAFLGYIGLARFVIQQIVLSGGILATMYIGFLSAGAISTEGAFQNSAIGRRIAAGFGMSETALDRLGIFVSFLINILVLAWGVPLILLQWGFQWGDIRAWAYQTASEINIGTVSFSLIGLATGVAVFFGGFFVTRWFQRWLDGTVLTRSRIDSGVRNSIRTSIGYAGIALAALIGISAAGIDLSNLALVAGALSLGIGFGLQNIVSNFVSGLILLAERPFKAGDWIVAGGVEGTVKRVNVRATEIETFQRQTIIMPNSELINAAVGNWTHRNKLGRVEIAIGVAYGSDVRRVRDILLELAGNHDLVVKNPEPAVIFKDFGASSLDFELRMYLYDISNIMIVQNDLRFAILEAFQKEGIEIPFPQRDINLKGDVAAALAGNKNTPGRAKRKITAKPAAGKENSASSGTVDVVMPKRRRTSKRKIDPDD